jgi:cell division protein FtsN
MSDTAFYENQYEAAPQSGRWKSMFGGLAAAVLSLTMLGAVVAWAYQISVRDAYDVPVVRAIEGAMKQRPEKSGGLQMGGTDVKVTRMVSGEESTGDATLAPRDEGLAPEDKPVDVIRRETEAAEVVDTAPQLKPADTAAEEELKVASIPAPGPTTPVAAEPEPTIGTTTGTPIQPLQDSSAVTELAPDRSPPVAVRPKTLDTTASTAPASSTTNTPVTSTTNTPVASTTNTPVTSTTNTPVSTAPIAAGDPVVQLGAFTTRQLAERVWKDQKVINGRLFRGMEPTITPVQSGGRELYRLRVGPYADADEAKKVCVVLKARGADCIVTRAE